MSEFTILPATPSETESIRVLLVKAELPSEDFARHLQHFLVARQNDALIGTIGLETYEAAGLLRSLVVIPDYRGQGIGKQLCERAFVYAQELGIKELYLLTTTAERFFPKLGFSVVERDCVPASIQATEEFSTICPSTAVCMAKKIGPD